MFPDAQYYATINLGNSAYACIVRGMDFYEFFIEFKNRHNRFPYVQSLVPLDQEEFELFYDYFDSEGQSESIYDNGVEDDY